MRSFLSKKLNSLTIQYYTYFLAERVKSFLKSVKVKLKLKRRLNKWLILSR